MSLLPRSPRIVSYVTALLFVLIAFGVESCLAQPAAPAKLEPAKLEPAQLGKTRNVTVCGKLFLSGQPSQEDIQAIKAKGVKRVVTLRTDGEVDWDEGAALKEAGIAFVEVPFLSADSLNDKLLDRLRKLMRESDDMPTLVHCGSANRVGAVWLAHRVLDEKVPLETALKEAKTVGLKSSAHEKKVKDYITRKLGEASVAPGINKRFLDPNLKVDEWVTRFEGESREVFRSRNEILDALQLAPGHRVADIGAGTGFFSLGIASRVAPTRGWVYAVDISPRFIEHIRKASTDANIGNLTPVLCREDSVTLPADSIDAAFVCDTYHHFEYPQSTLKSILNALRPGGVLLVIDFERIPGVSREFILGHVRAGKEEFRAEIEAAGFQFEKEVKVGGLRENYCLRFRKPKTAKRRR